MTEGGLDVALAWLRGTASAPIPVDWVPGALAQERRALGVLGAVARHALGGRVPSGWPTPINTWLSAASTVEVPNEVKEQLDKNLAIAPDAALATLYARLVAGERRRVLGTFFTPAVEVDPMLEMWDATEAAPSHVVDVGAGVGVFTAAAAQRWTDAHVSAVDVNPVTLGLLGARMAQADVADCATNVELVLGDFTEWLLSLRRTEGERRLILGNPPYTRSQLIPPAMRSRLADATAHLCRARASLSAYITALSLLHLAPSDGLCLLLPAQWLESEYAINLRRHLLGLHNRRVELRLVNSAWFEDATVDAVVLMVGTERVGAQPFLVAEWGELQPTPIDREAATACGWRQWFDDDKAAPATAPDHRCLRDVVDLRRGTATGANDFFLLSDDLVAEHSIPEWALVPVVRRLAPFSNTVTQHRFDSQGPNERRWLLKVNLAESEKPGVKEYLALGQSWGVDQRHLCATRAKGWYDLEHDLTNPDVIITSMTRDKIRVVDNQIGAAITNNLYGWNWKAGVTQKTRRAVLGWLRGAEGQEAILAECRRQGDGLSKIEPRALAALPLPESLFA